jgi:aromatic-L-amino-acid decarboxylase
MLSCFPERSPNLRRGRLDPGDWPALRELGHRMLDEMLDSIEAIRSLPVWRPMPQTAREALREPAPDEPTSPQQVYRQFREAVAPYATGNRHPRFFGWVHGSGTAGGMLAEMLAAGLNSNAGGRDHAAIEVERVVVGWFRSLFGLPDEASGLIVTGTSLANFIAVVVARTARLGPRSRADGLRGAPPLVAYASVEAHASVDRAFELSGLGGAALRKIPVDRRRRIDVELLEKQLAADREAGLEPFALIGMAGTVNTGAIDDLARLADVAARERLWFHVDGAFGALVALSPALRPRLRGIERADSIAFDFHKWLHVPYDAACVLVRDGELHRAAFAGSAPYLTPAERGLAAGAPWPCDFGPELSRGFRALKVWFTIKEHGLRRLGAAIAENVRQADLLGRMVEAHPLLELLAPVELNIVCFRFRPPAPLEPPVLDELNEAIVFSLQESGVAAPSLTTLDGVRSIRVNLTNHRTDDDDLELLLHEISVRGERLAAVSDVAAG